MKIEKQLWFWLAALVLVVLTIALLRDILLPFIAAIVIAYFLNPLADRLEARGLPRIWAAIIILSREILVSGLREYLAELRVKVAVTQLAKWKTTVQMVAIGFLIAGEAGDRLCWGLATPVGLVLLWLAALVTLYTGYDYFRAGLRHMID